jgi:hypothetical protein
MFMIFVVRFAIWEKAYKIGELAFEDLDKKFELHLALTHECLLAIQGQYGFQAYLKMCLDGGNIHMVAITSYDSSSIITFVFIVMQSLL